MSKGYVQKQTVCKSHGAAIIVMNPKLDVIAMDHLSYENFAVVSFRSGTGLGHWAEMVGLWIISSGHV